MVQCIQHKTRSKFSIHGRSTLYRNHDNSSSASVLNVVVCSAQLPKQPWEWKRSWEENLHIEGGHLVLYDVTDPTRQVYFVKLHPFLFILISRVSLIENILKLSLVYNTISSLLRLKWHVAVVIICLCLILHRLHLSILPNISALFLP